MLLGVRPEHLVVAPEANPGAEAEGEQEDGALRGWWRAVEPLIAERAQLVHVLPDSALSGGGAGPDRAAPWPRPSPGGSGCACGSTPQQLLLFDAATERALAPG